MTNIVEGGPNCERDDCVITEGNKFSTLTYYGQMTDANGNMIPNDKNVTTSTKHCLSCGKIWVQSTQSGFITNWNFK